MTGKTIYLTKEECELLLIMVQRIEHYDVDYKTIQNIERKILKK